MDLSNLIAISGMPGLFKVVGQMKNGIIAEGLADGKKSPVYASHKVSALEDISIYAASGDIPLKQVFTSIHHLEKGGLIDAVKIGSNNDLKAYFLTVLADYDEDRVYVSDIKKVVKWYNQLSEAGLAVLEEKEEKPKKVKKAKKTAKNSDAEAISATEEKK